MEQFFEEIQPARIPRHYIAGLVGYFQSRQNPQHGNALDAKHAMHLLDCDLLLTADSSFYKCLIASQTWMHCRGRPVFVRQLDDPVTAIRLAVEEGLSESAPTKNISAVNLV
jgi:hypothetical protein